VNKIRETFFWLYKILKEHGGYFITTFIYSALPLLFLPILTRYLEPAEYANIALFNFYFAISNSLVGTSIPAMLSKHFFDKPKEYVAKIIGNSLFIVFALSLILSLLLLLLSKFLQTHVELPLLWIYSIPVCSFFFIVFNIALTVMRNSKKVFTFSIHKISNIFSNVTISIVFVVVLTWGWQGRLLGILISYLLSAIAAIIYLKNKRYISLDFSFDIIKKTSNLLMYLLPNSFQSIIISQVGIFFIQYYFTKELLGIYSAGFQISTAVKLLYLTIGLSWAPFLYEKFSTPSKIDKIRLVKLFYLLSFILFLSVLFLNLFSDTILKLFTTPSYYNAKIFIPWFSIGFMFNGLTVLLTPILIKMEQQKRINRISLVNMILMIIFNIIFIKLFGYIGIGIAFCITYLLMLTSFIYAINRVFPLPWFYVFKLLTLQQLNRKKYDLQ
jgi:O-antigen/teichoic acid export membrane protein